MSIWVMDNTSTDQFDPIVEAINLFRERPTEVEFQIHVASPADIEKPCTTGAAISGSLGSKIDYLDLEYDYLHSEENTLYCGKRHPLFERAAGQISDDILQTADFARRGVPVEKNSILEPNWLSSAAATHMEGRLHLIRTGLYVGYLPTHYAAGWEQRGELRKINPDRFLVRWPIYAVWRKMMSNLP
ncbi:LysR substrate-binding domain-containing protein [Rhizobium beringeri]